ncbi:D-threo-aldose 1-dehydrogenase [Alteribacter lacisalsi]|uniref:D-threo-aldose 1-dehydrogenase n=1 Tax=Alteribacter lacisalsi TaxID=2045244 RepID=A0A2W0H769_9BACI|nr:aldo/keto reductase [Alteribacter lacisalsi]PYZ97713.1 D-threo-aldose 1-dehydrogenase [Alteribacter lacisalsi]
MSILNGFLDQKIGFGTAPLGNLFRDIPEEEAQETIEAVWNEGIRYIDTAPFYGAGLAEARLGEFLKNKPRDEYVLSTKVGRIISDETEKKEGLFAHGRQNKIIEEYTEDATKRSIEQSLNRLQTDRLDIVYVHDISPDFHGDQWVSLFDEARKGAFRVLNQMKEEGVIKEWGLGVNMPQPIELALQLEETVPTLSLQATHYTLMNHQRALDLLMPLAQKRESGIVVGAPYNSGALLGGDHYDYAEADSSVKNHVRRLQETADNHGVSLKAAALQFSTAHPAVEAVIPGSTRPDRIKEDVAALKETIPAAFWEELISKELISAKAPLPSGR